MSSVGIAMIVLASLCAGALVGFILRLALPGHHLSAESKDTIKLGTGLIATMAALVLGLLVGSAKGSYDTQRAEVIQMSSKFILLDRILAHFGSQANEAREKLKSVAESMEHLLWHDPSQRAAAFAPKPSNEKLYDLIAA